MLPKEPRFALYTNAIVLALLKAELEAFELRLAAEVRSPVAFIHAIGEDLVDAGGKRLRPQLAFLAARLLGVEAVRAMPVALAVELLHSASLLHDDLIDEADTRRGAQTAFRRYGNVVSVMSGDFLLARVLMILAQEGHNELTALMADTARRICEAEVQQFQNAALQSYEMASYLEIIDGKTAVLFAAAMEGVAILAGAERAQRRALHDFGLYYGRAFQMQDDCLDLLSTPEALGKPVGGDLREGKATLPTLLLLEQQAPAVRQVLERHARGAGDVARVKELISEYGIEPLAQAKIRDLVQRADQALAMFPASEAKAILLGLTKREVERRQ